jgi:hypothetical protein
MLRFAISLGFGIKRVIAVLPHPLQSTVGERLNKM